MVAETRPGYGARARQLASPSYQAYQLLHVAFAALPIVAGLDKFFYALADWNAYLSPAFAAISPLSPFGTMYVVGLIEVGAGLIVAFRPRTGGWIVAGWLGLIVLNLLMLGTHWDIALRDLALMLGAIALARITPQRGRRA